MKDAFTVRGVQSVRETDAVSDHACDFDGTAREPLLQRLTLEQFHRDERRLAGLACADVIDRADMRMIERGGGPRFLRKAAQAITVG